MGLDRFWRYACERIFVLEELMLAVGLDRCLHVESDVLMYLTPHGLMPWLSDAYGSAVAICPLTATEDTSAVMYVGSLRSLSRLTKALLELVKMGLRCWMCTEAKTPMGSGRRCSSASALTTAVSLPPAEESSNATRTARSWSRT